MDFGGYLSVLLLDTDHSGPIDGAQTSWLARTLAERRNGPHVFPSYPVPASPSVRNPEGDTHRRVRQHGVPLFEENGLKLDFEAHDHVYKRTFPIRQGQATAPLPRREGGGVTPGPQVPDAGPGLEARFQRPTAGQASGPEVGIGEPDHGMGDHPDVPAVEGPGVRVLARCHRVHEAPPLLHLRELGGSGVDVGLK